MTKRQQIKRRLVREDLDLSPDLRVSRAVVDGDDLVAGRVPRRRHDDDGAVAEYVEVVVVEDYRLRVAQRVVCRRLDDALRAIAEHVIALGLLHDPCRVRERVGVARVVGMVVRQREVRDVARLVPGVIEAESLEEESFSAGLLEYPHYTRPVSFRGWDVPPILLSGHHAEIERWRKEAAIAKTRRNRPDLLNSELNKEHRK